MENQMKVSYLTLTPEVKVIPHLNSLSTLTDQVRRMVCIEHEQEIMYGESDVGVMFDLDPRGQGHTTYSLSTLTDQVRHMVCIEHEQEIFMENQVMISDLTLTPKSHQIQTVCGSLRGQVRHMLCIQEIVNVACSMQNNII